MAKDALFQAILDSPDDESLRLVYADYLEEHGDLERSEFIRVQCRLAHLPEKDPRQADLKARERALLQDHCTEWVRPLGNLVKWPHFFRGFVEWVDADPANFLVHAEKLLGLAPIREVSYSRWESAGRQLRLLSECPYVARLRAIDLGFYYYVIADPELELLASLPILMERLSSLSFVECSVTEQGLRQVLISPHLKRMASVFIKYCDMDGEGAVRAVVESPCVRGLQSLSITYKELVDDAIRTLAACPALTKLRVLDLANCDITNEGAIALSSSRGLENLEYLDLGWNQIEDSGAEAIVLSPGLANLKTVFVRGNPISPTGEKRLKALGGDWVRVITDSHDR